MSGWRKNRRLVIPAPKQETYTYDELYAEYWPAIHRLFYYAFDDYHEAEDLTQEVIIRIWKFWNRIQWDKLSGAIAVIVNNVRIDHGRDKLNKVDKDFYDSELEFECHDEGITDPLRLLVIERARTAIEEFTEVLRDKDKELFLDYYTRDVSMDELVEKHGMKRTHIHVRLFHIRKLLFECYASYDLLPDGDFNRGTSF